MPAADARPPLTLDPLRRVEQYARLSDADLVQRANGGDRRALDALLDRYSASIARLTSHLLGDIEDARDAAQESLLKVSTRLRQFRGESQFSTWVHRVVVNTCRDLAARQRLRRAEPFDETTDARIDEEGDPSRLAALAEARRDMVAALSRLTVEQRRVLLLRDAFDLPYDEIARRLRIPVGTAKSYVHRARARLRGRLEEQRDA